MGILSLATIASHIQAFSGSSYAAAKHSASALLLAASNNDDDDLTSSAASTKQASDEFPFSPDELIAMTQDYLANPSPDYWADDFVFRGPVIGPLCKKDLINTLSANDDLNTAFPDLEANTFGFVADDPFEPNRVWFMCRIRGTFSGPFKHPTKGIFEPTGAKYIGPPESRSVVWNADGKIRMQTVGYVTDRFTGDTTGGRGAIFGAYAVMGEELPSDPGNLPLVLLQKLSEFLPGVPKSYSRDEDLPAWWTDRRRGAER